MSQDVVIQGDFTGSIHQTATTQFSILGVGAGAARSGNETASLPVFNTCCDRGSYTAEYKRDDEVRATDLHLQCCFPSLYRYSSFTLYSNVSWPYK